MKSNLKLEENKEQLDQKDFLAKSKYNIIRFPNHTLSSLNYRDGKKDKALTKKNIFWVIGLKWQNVPVLQST